MCVFTVNTVLVSLQCVLLCNWLFKSVGNVINCVLTTFALRTLLFLFSYYDLVMATINRREKVIIIASIDQDEHKLSYVTA